MTIVLLVLHGLSATLLLGAVTHQAIAVWWPSRREASWWRSLRAVHAERYVAAVVVLFATTFALGALLYPPFRLVARAQSLDVHAPWATGLFEVKEHAAALGLALLPAYARAWRDPSLGARRASTTLLLLATWWNFVVGHVVNNARGL